MSTDLRQALHDNCDTLNYQARQLEALSSAAAILGMKELSDKLGHIAMRIATTQSEIRDAYSRHLHAELAQSKKDLADTMMAMVSGMKIEDDDKGGVSGDITL